MGKVYTYQEEKKVRMAMNMLYHLLLQKIKMAVIGKVIWFL